MSVLEVLLHGIPIGTLARRPDADRNRPTLGLGFKDAHGQLITDLQPTSTRLLPWFSNLLPEGHLREYLARRAEIDPAHEFFLLRILGQDLPGAIGVRPFDRHAGPPAPDRRHDAAVEDHDGRGPAGRGPAGGVHDDALHLSLGGVQLEFPAVNEASGKMTIPARGVGGSWIVKLPSSRFEGVSENEFSMMTLARLIGMAVPAVRLIDTASIGNLPDGTGSPKGQAFAIERFDRPQGGAPVHIEDFAQVFGVYPEAKYRKAGYRNIATVLRAETTDSDIAEFVRRLVFNVLIGNADMHLKNWSLIYPDRRKAALSPAYDFIDDRLHSRRQGGAHLQRNEAP